MNQSELKQINTCNERQAQENACKQVGISLGFTSDCSESGARFFNQSQSKVKQNQSKMRIPFDNQLKTTTC